MSYHPDKWAKRAKTEGYLARSAYKLLAIDRKFHIFEKGDLVLDLGSAPGSWVQVALEKIGPNGFVVGVDAEHVRLKISINFAFLKKDIYDSDLNQNLSQTINSKFDILLSDLSPSTTGQKDIDQWRAHELSLRALDIARRQLKIGGRAVVKVFQGPDTPELLKFFKESFNRVNFIKPEASNKGSKEAYIIAIGFKINK